MAVPKVRIYDLSKELDLPSKTLIDHLEKQYQISVKSHSSSIDQPIADKLKADLSTPNGKSTASAKPAPKTAEPAKASKPAVKAATAPTSAEAKPTAKPPAKTEPVTPVKSSAATAPVKASASAKTAPKVEPELTEDDDPAVLEILAPPPAEDEPYTAIAKDVERHQKVDHGKTTLKDIAAEDKTEKVIAPVVHHKKDPHQDAVAIAEAPVAEVETKEILPHVKLEGPMSILELAQILKKRETELIRHLFMKGVMVTVNQTMQVEDAISLAQELGFDAEGPDKKAEVDKYSAPELKVRHTSGKNLKHRAPVVSIMGHVDHGKTSLLDAIRETRHKIVDTEAGGITQSIGAYTVMKDDQKIVFIDTPGHEAFTSMRMRGAQSTDIAILVVAADDGVMPQTIEAINHAKAANIPIIVAVNKIDKPGADPEKVLVQLADHGLNSEKWGGDTITVEVSALQKLGLDDLLEMIILVSELQELKADSGVPAEGIVIEARLDKGKGAVADLLVQNGTLRVGENILIGKNGGRVRALISDTGERIQSAGPSTPVEILGLNDVPLAGDTFIVVHNDKDFKRMLQERQVQDRDQRLSKVAAPGLMTDSDTQRKDFYLIIKGDTQGSIEAITASLLQLATGEVSVHILHGGTGDVSEADVLLASASNAIIIAFNVKEEANAQRVAVDRGIAVRPYNIIYNVIEDMEKLMLGLLSPETEEQELGVAEVRQLFSFGKTTIAGCYITEGKLVRNGQCRVYRNNKEIFKGPLSNLKRFKDDAREVAAGYECGVSFDRFNDLQPGDIIKYFTITEKERTSL